MPPVEVAHDDLSDGRNNGRRHGVANLAIKPPEGIVARRRQRKGLWEALEAAAFTRWREPRRRRRQLLVAVVVVGGGGFVVKSD